MQKQKGSLHKAAIQLLGEWCSFLFVGLLFYYYFLVIAYLLSLTPALGKGEKKRQVSREAQNHCSLPFLSDSQIKESNINTLNAILLANIQIQKWSKVSKYSSCSKIQRINAKHGKWIPLLSSLLFYLPARTTEMNYLPERWLCISNIQALPSSFALHWRGREDHRRDQSPHETW